MPVSRWLPISLGLTALPALAAQDEVAIRTEVISPRPLMIAALESPTGEAHGVLTGEIADAIRDRFAATTPIYIDVTTERRLPQSGCSRLNVLFWQDGVHLPAAQAAHQQSIAFGINYCRDGSPPRSTE